MTGTHRGRDEGRMPPETTRIDVLLIDDNADFPILIRRALESRDPRYRVTSVATGKSGGLYTISSSMSPTPEPGTFAMLLAGLGVVGFLSRRRLPR